MQKLRWAIIGPGNIARAFIADLALVTECENSVIAVMSDHPESAAEFARAHFIPFYYSDLNEMLENSPPDIVYIASPHAAHYKESLICLQHDIPVLCEKPFALNLRQAREIITTARTRHIFFLEGMWIRFLPSICQVLELLGQRVIGEINSIVADMSYRAPREAANRFYNPALGGGSLLDLGIYPVYLSRLLLGNPLKVKAVAGLSTADIDENCAMLFEYARGVYAMLESSIIKDTDNRACIYGEKGVITILKPWNEKPGGIEVSLYDGTLKKYPCEWKGRGFQFEVEEVARCLSDHRIESDKHTHTDSLQLIGMLDEIRAQTNITYPLYD
jgi:predicted dehydrogenase